MWFQRRIDQLRADVDDLLMQRTHHTHSHGCCELARLDQQINDLTRQLAALEDSAPAIHQAQAAITTTRLARARAYTRLNRHQAHSQLLLTPAALFCILGLATYLLGVPSVWLLGVIGLITAAATGLSVYRRRGYRALSIAAGNAEDSYRTAQDTLDTLMASITRGQPAA